MHLLARWAVLLLCLSPLLGCGASTGPAVAPPTDELTQFLKDNPDIANAPDEEEEPEVNE